MFFLNSFVFLLILICFTFIFFPFFYQKFTKYPKYIVSLRITGNSSSLILFLFLSFIFPAHYLHISLSYLYLPPTLSPPFSCLISHFLIVSFIFITFPSISYSFPALPFPNFSQSFPVVVLLFFLLYLSFSSSVHITLLAHIPIRTPFHLRLGPSMPSTPSLLTLFPATHSSILPNLLSTLPTTSPLTILLSTSSDLLQPHYGSPPRQQHNQLVACSSQLNNTPEHYSIPAWHLSSLAPIRSTPRPYQVKGVGKNRNKNKNRRLEESRI